MAAAGPAHHGLKPAIHDRRKLLNAMLYWLRAGCAWPAAAHDLPPWKTVYHYLRCWRLDGSWQQMVRVLRARSQYDRAGGRHDTTATGKPASPSTPVGDGQHAGGRCLTQRVRRSGRPRPQTT
jgi:putative transposase